MSNHDGRAYERDGKLVVPWRLAKSMLTSEEEKLLERRIEEGEPGIPELFERLRQKRQRIQELGVDIILLLTPQEFETLPDGTTVISILGEEKVKGQDYIDQNTRSGYLACGLPASDDQ